MARERGPASFNVLKAASGENPWKEERPDWGHGPNKPVQLYSENEVRAVLERFEPGDFEKINAMIDMLRSQHGIS